MYALCECSRSRAAVLVVPYAPLVPEIRIAQAISAEYANGGEALHAVLTSKPIVASSKTKNLGSLLVKASH